MNIRLRKFQEGGPMGPEPAPAPAPEQGGAPQGGDPVQELAGLAQQALQAQDCQAALQVCDGFLQLVMGQGGAPAGEEAGAPAPEAAPAEGEPVYRNGGVLAYRG